MKGKFLLFLIIAFCIINFSIQEVDITDISSFSNINEIRQNKIDLDLNIDFDNKKYCL